MAYLFTRNVLTLVAVISGTTTYDLSKKFLDEGGPDDLELAQAAQPVATIFLKVLLFVRAILFIAAIKWRRLSQLAFYLESLIEVFEVLTFSGRYPPSGKK